MIRLLDETHDPAARSWVESANLAGCDFPIQNLPFGVFETASEPARIGVAIGDRILDLHAACRIGSMPHDLSYALRQSTLNELMAIPRDERAPLRHAIFDLLREHSPHRADCESCLVPMSAARMTLPCVIGDYTDFYASIHHATRVGAMFRPANPLLPNYKWVPIAYHGRASSVVPSGTPVARPRGQSKTDASEAPVFGPTKRLDYELEVGFYVGPGNAAGQRIDIDRAEDRIFGFCLVNDWSARDIQAWEYQPLGPFLAKNFATSVSPWIVTLEALAPFRTAAFERPAGDPQPLPHLDSTADRKRGGFDIALEVWFSTARMRELGMARARLSRSNFRDLYWTPGQMLTHHASNGCPLKPGDLIASGTVSGSEDEARGCLLEITANGANPVELPGGETRRFLEDGDEVILRGCCRAPHAASIGFGECRGTVVAAHE